jgi:tRNA(adenine34) deaminase
MSDNIFLNVYTPEYFMRQALQEAQKAFEEGEVPVGAVVVNNGVIISRGYNQTEKLQDVTAHAEILAITAASNYLNSKYLDDCTIYITLEPCIMCAGALAWSQIGKVVFGATDDKRGFMLQGRHLLHPKTKLELGILEKECGEILTTFFKKLRK